MTVSILMDTEASGKSRSRQILFLICWVSFVLIVLPSTFFGNEPPKDTPQDLPHAFGPVVLSDSPDTVFVQSLIKNGFIERALETCRLRLQLATESQASADSIARWTMLLIQAEAAKGIANPVAFDQPKTIDEQLAKAKLLSKENENSTRDFWIRFQYQLGRYFVLQRTLAACLAAPSRLALREWSLETIRSCLDDLDQMQVQVQNAPGRGKPSTTKDQPTPAQWISLSNDIMLLRIDILLLRAQFTKPKSTERIGTGTEILDLIDTASSQISNNWAGRPRLELARCHALIMLDRPQESLNELGKFVTSLSAAVSPTGQGEVRQREDRWLPSAAILAAQANRELGNLVESEKWIQKVGGWMRSPELALEHFANLLAVTPSSSNTNASDMNARLADSLQVKNEIGKRFGSYWQQRAEAILVSSNLSENSSSLSNTNDPSHSLTPGAPTASKLRIELLMTEAKQFIAGKQWQKGIDKLNQAELSAANSGDAVHALEIAMKAAAVIASNGQWSVAQDEFFRAAVAYREAPKSPDAAMMSVWDRNANVGGAIILNPDKEAEEQRQAILRGRLSEIISMWPESPQAETAALRLDQAYAAADNIGALLQLWSNRLELVSTSRTYDLTLARLGMVSVATQEAWIDRSRYTEKEILLWKVAMQELRKKLIERAPLEARSMTETLLAVVDSSGSLANAASNSKQWEQKPSGPSESKLPESIRWLHSDEPVDLKSDNPSFGHGPRIALCWLRTELSYQRLLAIRDRGPEDAPLIQRFVTNYEQLRAAKEAADGTFRTWMGERQFAQLEQSIRSYEIAIDFWYDKIAPSIEAMKELAKQSGKSPWWPYRSARLLQTIPGQRELAIQQYRALAKGFIAGSDAWLEMRARTVQTMRWKGDAPEAQKLADLVLATYPNMSDEWKKRFAQ